MDRFSDTKPSQLLSNFRFDRSKYALCATYVTQHTWPTTNHHTRMHLFQVKQRHDTNYFTRIRKCPFVKIRVVFRKTFT